MISPLVRRIVGISVLLGVTGAFLPYLTSGRSPSETANNIGISISQTEDKRKTFASRSTVRLQGQKEKAGEAVPDAPDQDQIEVREPEQQKERADAEVPRVKAGQAADGDPDEPVMPTDDELKEISKKQAAEEKAQKARREADEVRRAAAEKKASAEARARKEAENRKLEERQKAARQAVEEKKASERKAAEEKKARERERIAEARKAAEEKKAAERKAAEERKKMADARAEEERKQSQPAKPAAEQKAFASRLNAVKYRDELRSKGYPNARMEPVTRDGRVLFRVVSGERN